MKVSTSLDTGTPLESSHDSVPGYYKLNPTREDTPNREGVRSEEEEPIVSEALRNRGK